MRFEDLTGKRTLVTGASSGIGAATAELLARQGCFVGVHYFRTEDGARQTLQKVQKSSDGCMLRADLRNSAQAKAMVREFVSAAGGLDVLVNNAGTMIARQDIADAPEEFFDDVFATNTGSVFFTTQAAIEHLRKSRGCIVNVGSVAGHTGGAAGSGIYAAAKAAVAALTMAMAKEFAPLGVRVNSVLPGLIETRFHRQYSTPDRVQKVAEETPLGRNGTAEDVAKAIVFLSSGQAAGFITGEYLAVNGGLYMRA